MKMSKNNVVPNIYQLILSMMFKNNFWKWKIAFSQSSPKQMAIKNIDLPKIL